MMRNKLLLIALVTIFLFSCKSPAYLSNHNEIDKNVYGAYTKIFLKKDFPLEGELIALENDVIIILPKNKNTCEIIELKNVRYFLIQYASSKNNAWLLTIPLSIVTPFIHGYYSVISFPVNLISTISLASSKDAQYKLRSKKYSHKDLKMYARFPQGIPKNIDISTIKKNY